MLFNTKEFAIFYALILILYWALFKWRTLQNLILLCGSMYFYSRLHWTFPVYLAILIAVSYLFASIISRMEAPGSRKWLLRIAVFVISIGLIYTKYSGLFFSNFQGLSQWQASALHILVPVGISFYTFSTLGYVIDVYRRTIPCERNVLTYAAYISFFPHLLSGPIPAAGAVLSHFRSKAKVTLYSVDEAIGEIIWGLFKKMVVADNISLAVSYCFGQYKSLNGSTLFIGVLLFGVQLYADFSGYSSMARGFASLLGIDILQNFNLPFSSKSVSEYWRRWHISLTNWFTAYIFNPTIIALRDWGEWSVVAGLMLTFFISGFWHGAGWQFVIWGLLHGLAMVYEYLTKKKRKKIFRKMPPFLGSLLSSLSVLLFLGVAWVFFRSKNVPDSLGMLSRIFSPTLFAAPLKYIVQYLPWCIPMFVVEWLQRKAAYTMDIQYLHIPERIMKNKKTPNNIKLINISMKMILYTVLCTLIYLYCKKQNMAEYYYFKF